MSMSRRMALRAAIMHTDQYTVSTGKKWRDAAIASIGDSEMEAAYSDMKKAARRLRSRASHLIMLEDPQEENTDA